MAIYSASNLPSFSLPSLLSFPASLPSDRAEAHVELLHLIQCMLSSTPHSVDAVYILCSEKKGREGDMLEHEKE